MASDKAPNHHNDHKKPPVPAEIVSEKLSITNLCHEDAVAGSPEDIAVMGEEDAGGGLEFLVRETEDRNKIETSEKN